MKTPNQMPKKPNRLRQQIVGALIHTVPTSWDRKYVSKSHNGVDSEKVEHQTLRNPLAKNVSEQNVERIARAWL
jgi:hypothetical protein